MVVLRNATPSLKSLCASVLGWSWVAKDSTPQFWNPAHSISDLKTPPLFLTGICDNAGDGWFGFEVVGLDQ